MPRKEFPSQYKNWYRIADAHTKMGVAHSQYVRQLVQKKFQHETIINPNTGEKEPGAIKIDMGSYKVWAINPTIVENYKARQTTRSGLRRYTVRFDSTVITPETLEAALRATVAAAHDVAPTDLTAETFSFEPSYKKKASGSGQNAGKGLDLSEVSEDATVELDFLNPSS